MKQCIIFVVCHVMLVFCSVLLAGSVTEEWVARYDGEFDTHDSAKSIAVDDLGNVYVTGSSDGNIVTIKYDPVGNELWVRSYDGPGQGFDAGFGIAVDTSGNVHVVGTSVGLTTAADITTIKYDTYGNELWVSRFDLVSQSDQGRALAVDIHGNVLVTGWNFASTSDYATVKYNSDGNLLWVRRYDGPAANTDRVEDIAVDLSGNVYVTGRSIGSGTSFDYATLKYSPDGDTLWIKRFHRGNDQGEELALDSAANVVVTGRSDLDYMTVKYDTDGNELWVAAYDGPASGQDYTEAVAVDESGNVYVTGFSLGVQSEHDYATVKYDADGNQLWVARYNGPANDDDQGRAIAVDDSGNVYVLGESVGIDTDFDYATVKYDAGGNLLWVARYDGPVSDEDRGDGGIVVTSSGDVHVTGRSKGSQTPWKFDYATVKYAEATDVPAARGPALLLVVLAVLATSMYFTFRR